MNNKKVLALFDFDGTITCKDSFLEFLKYFSGGFKYYVKLIGLLPVIGLFFAGIIKNGKLKESFLKSFIKGRTVADMESVSMKFLEDIVPGFLREDAIDKINWHKSEGHTIALVSASASLWLKPFADLFKMHLLCTDLEIVDGAYTGCLSGANCNEEEKVNRIKALFNLSDYDEIYAYGASSGDREMLKIADRPYYKPFTK